MIYFFLEAFQFFSAVHSKNYIFYHYTHVHRSRNRKIHKIAIALIMYVTYCDICYPTAIFLISSQHSTWHANQKKISSTYSSNTFVSLPVKAKVLE